jgi:cyclase
MLSTRVIPVLLLHKNGLYKTVRFKSPKYIGDPLNAIKIFNEKEVDELIVLDIDKSKKGEEPDFEMISAFASECFMPVCYGGGITKIEQIQKIFSIGIEKVALNTAALKNIDFIKEAVRLFGSQSIVVTIDVKKNLFGKYKIYNHATKKTEKKDLETYIHNLNTIGIGEIMINNVDLDGTQTGYDIPLLKRLTQLTNIPMIACGGAGKLEDFKNAKEKGGVSAVAAGSFFVFNGRHNAVLITYPKYTELEKLFNEKDR